MPDHGGPAQDEFDGLFARAALRDVAWAQRRLRARKERRGEVYEGVQRRLLESAEWVERRDRSIGRITYPPELPVAQRKDEIAGAIRDHQVVVVCGETGSGKTTQLPKICLELGLGRRGLIGHTQPRRLAARAVATRVAQELGSSIGGAVGFKVRFTDRTTPEALVKVMTDGILLAETQGDRQLLAYEAIIIDEAHERSLNIDFLLGYLRRLIDERPELKVIITSATIDPESFATHFASRTRAVPVIEVSGRTYPVEVRYRGLPVDQGETTRGVNDAIIEAAAELCREGPGDILVFLPGEREIREAHRALRKHHPEHTEILPLYARLSERDQQRIFASHPYRRIVLATNVAETSLTVPGIRSVIDTGLARISRYSARSKIQQLPVEPISRASANQRSGRCGRLGPGVCIRLFEESDYAQRDEFTPPEILRSNLASVILQMKALRLGAIEAFPFIEPPKPAMIRAGRQTLQELGALTEDDALTEIGRRLARLPIDPRLGRMLLAAEHEHALREVLVIASAIAAQDPRERPHEERDLADIAHAQFRNEESDFLSLHTLWEVYHERAGALSRSALKRWCAESYISHRRMREWIDVHRQLRDLMHEMGVRRNTEPAGPDAIHRSLLTALATNVGVRDKNGEYLGVRGTRLLIHPSSGVYAKRPKWIMAAEIVQTTQLYARTAASIDPAWIERVAAHMVTKSHSSPRWDARSGRAIASERVTLLGLEIVAARTVNLGPIDPVEARRLLILHGLVQGQMDTRARFMRENERTLRMARRLAAKLRDTTVVAEPEVRAAFFDQRLPADAWSESRLDRWRKQAERSDPDLLCMSIGDVLDPRAPEIVQEDFPDRVEAFGTTLSLDYSFDPGAERDGVTARVPLDVLGSADPDRCAQLIPGVLRETVTLLIRALPRSQRRQLDAQGVADGFVRAGVRPRGSLAEALSRWVREHHGVHITPGEWPMDQLPEHTRVRFEVVDRGGRVLDTGRDLRVLRERLKGKLTESLSESAPEQWNRPGLSAWDFGDLPESVPVNAGGVEIRAFPALVPNGGGVDLRLMPTRELSDVHTRRGVVRLAVLSLRDELRYHAGHIPGIDRLRVLYATLGPGHELEQDMIGCIADLAVLDEGGVVRTQQEFARRVDRAWNRIGPSALEVGELLEKVLTRRQKVVVRLEGDAPKAWSPSIADMRDQLAHLTPPGFIADTPIAHLRHLPRYLTGMMARLDRLPNAGLERDTRNLLTVVPFWEVAKALLDAVPADDPRRAGVERFRWMIEEFRVSLFAQELGTGEKVSEKRLRELFDRIR